MNMWVIIGITAWIAIVVVAVALARAAALGDRQAHHHSPYGPVQKWGYKDDRR